jgi:hypothetical protein
MALVCNQPKKIIPMRLTVAYLFYFLASFLMVLSEASGQNVSPKQIQAATAPRVSQPTKKYILVSDPNDGGRFWYMLLDSARAGGTPQYSVPSWQKVTDVGDVTNHFVTASGLTLTQLATGGAPDSIIVVKDGVLKRYPRYQLPVHQSFRQVVSDATTVNPLPIGSNVGAIPIQNATQLFWLNERATGLREVVKDSQSIQLPMSPPALSTLDIVVQSNIRKLQFVTPTGGIPIDSLTKAFFQNVEYGSVFRCQLTSEFGLQRWLIYKITNTVYRQDTVEMTPNRVINVSEFSKNIFLTARSGTWTQGDGIEFRLPKYPGAGQEITFTNQFGLIPSNTEFRFTATGGYSFKFPSSPTKVFAYDPLSINTTADAIFTNQEFQFRCSANTADKRWSCFLISQ